jgi:hypothetical protein
VSWDRGEFAWQPEMQRAGLHRDGLYLVRPDGYVALAALEQSAPVQRQLNLSAVPASAAIAKPSTSARGPVRQRTQLTINAAIP